MKHIANIMQHQYGKDEMTIGRIFESGRGKSKKYIARMIAGESEVIDESKNVVDVCNGAIMAHPFNFIDRPI